MGIKQFRSLPLWLGAFSPETDTRGAANSRRRSRLWGRLFQLATSGLMVFGGAGTLVVVEAGQALAVNDIPTVISNTTNWIVGILAGLATLFLTVGGVRYLMAGGDPGEVEKAKTALKAAAIGYALAMLAPVILDVLKSIVGSGGTTNTPTTPQGPASGAAL
jgi:hypothetical protein